MISSELYDSAPDGAGGVRLTLRTRDSRTTGPAMRLFGPDDAVRSATRRERGHMTRDDEPLRVGVGQYLTTPPTMISLGRVWNGINDAARAAGVDPQDLDLSEEQAQGFMAAVVDALKRRSRDQGHGPAVDVPPGEKTGTKDARPSIHAAAAKQTRDFAAGLAPARAALTAAPGTAPAPKARCSAAEFAALRVRKGAAA